MYRIRVFTIQPCLMLFSCLSSELSAVSTQLSQAHTQQLSHASHVETVTRKRLARRPSRLNAEAVRVRPRPRPDECRETERREPNDLVWTYEQPPYSSAYCRLVGIPTFHKINYLLLTWEIEQMESRRIQQLYRIPTCYRYTAVTGERRAFRVTARALLHSRSHPSRDSRLFQVRLSISLAGAWSMVSAASLPRYLESRLGPLLGPRSLRVCSAHAARRALARCGPPSM